MAVNLDENLKPLELNRLSDFIAYSILYYIENLTLLWKKIFILFILSFLVAFLLYHTLNGEFNLTFFLSNEGKFFLSFATLLLIINDFNMIFQSIKISIFQNMNLRSTLFKFKIFLLAFIRLALFLTFLASLFFEENFWLIGITFLILNTIFYQIVFLISNRFFYGFVQRRNFAQYLKLNLKSFLLIILNRFLIIFIPLIVTFTIFFVYESMRILITGEIFFFVIDRLSELKIFAFLFLTLLLFLSPFQYFCLMIFHKQQNIITRTNYEKNENGDTRESIRNF
jgi:hypothetical protein